MEWIEVGSPREVDTSSSIPNVIVNHDYAWKAAGGDWLSLVQLVFNFVPESFSYRGAKYTWLDFESVGSAPHDFLLLREPGVLVIRAQFRDLGYYFSLGSMN